MTSGSNTFDQMATLGTYKSRTWTGSNDPVNHKSENTYSAFIRSRINERMSETDIPSGTVIWNDFRGYEISETKPVWQNNSELALLGKLTTAIREHDFNAGIFAAEFHKTLNSVVSSSLTVLTAYRQCRRGNFPDAVRTLARAVEGTGVRKDKFGRFYERRSELKSTDVSDTWLALQYGWLPLLKDISEAMRWIESKTALPREVSIRVRKKQGPTYVDRPAPGQNYWFWTAETAFAELRVRLVESVSVARSLGLLNPASILWEVVPFSFVVDWFIPIGSYLDTVGFLEGLSLNYARSMKYIVEGTKTLYPCKKAFWPSAYPIWPHSQYCHPDWVSRYPGGVASYRLHNGGTVHRRLVWVDRTTGTSLSVPTPRPKDVEQALSIPHLQNAAALIWSGIAKARN